MHQDLCGHGHGGCHPPWSAAGCCGIERATRRRTGNYRESAGSPVAGALGPGTLLVDLSHPLRLVLGKCNSIKLRTFFHQAGDSMTARTCQWHSKAFGWTMRPSAPLPCITADIGAASEGCGRAANAHHERCGRLVAGYFAEKSDRCIVSAPIATRSPRLRSVGSSVWRCQSTPMDFPPPRSGSPESATTSCRGVWARVDIDRSVIAAPSARQR